MGPTDSCFQGDGTPQSDILARRDPVQGAAAATSHQAVRRAVQDC